MLPELSLGPGGCWDVGGRIAARLKGVANWKVDVAGDGTAAGGGALC